MGCDVRVGARQSVVVSYAIILLRKRGGDLANLVPEGTRRPINIRKPAFQVFAFQASPQARGEVDAVVCDGQAWRDPAGGGTLQEPLPMRVGRRGIGMN